MGVECDAYIALGSNIEPRRSALAEAIRGLRTTPGVRVVRLSRVRETEPVGPSGQGPYLNAVAWVQTGLTARALLDRCLSIEASVGRDRGREERWGPRRLDLDLLLFADAVIDEPGLTVPHPRLHLRTFVLEPLAEIAGGVLHPASGERIESLLRDVRELERREWSP